MVRVVDADGHVYDRTRMDEIAAYMPKGNQSRQIFPELDHLHSHHLNRTQRVVRSPGADEWVAFMDETGIDYTVLYPTAGLAVGRLINRDWAIAACQAYNNWLHDSFLQHSPKLQGVALIPIQDPDAAVAEMERAVQQLGMVGAMLPSNGEGLYGHLGLPRYWPIYEAAQQLECALGVHGGCHHDLGLDSFSKFYAFHALGHPFGIMVQAMGMLSEGVFDRFPRLRVAYLEGGATWVPFFMDRLDKSYRGHADEITLAGERVPGPREGQSASAYFREQVQAGRICVGFDSDDAGLDVAVRRTGGAAFLFASDFPHESITAESCRREIDELLERDDLTREDKEAALGGNAYRFYHLPA